MKVMKRVPRIKIKDTKPIKAAILMKFPVSKATVFATAGQKLLFLRITSM